MRTDIRIYQKTEPYKLKESLYEVKHRLLIPRENRPIPNEEDITLKVLAANSESAIAKAVQIIKALSIEEYDSYDNRKVIKDHSNFTDVQVELISVNQITTNIHQVKDEAKASGSVDVKLDAAKPTPRIPTEAELAKVQASLDAIDLLRGRLVTKSLGPILDFHDSFDRPLLRLAADLNDIRMKWETNPLYRAYVEKKTATPDGFVDVKLDTGNVIRIAKDVCAEIEEAFPDIKFAETPCTRAELMSLISRAMDKVKAPSTVGEKGPEKPTNPDISVNVTIGKQLTTHAKELRELLEKIHELTGNMTVTVGRFSTPEEADQCLQRAINLTKTQAARKPGHSA